MHWRQGLMELQNEVNGFYKIEQPEKVIYDEKDHKLSLIHI